MVHDHEQSFDLSDRRKQRSRYRRASDHIARQYPGGHRKLLFQRQFRYWYHVAVYEALGRWRSRRFELYRDHERNVDVPESLVHEYFRGHWHVLEHHDRSAYERFVQRDDDGNLIIRRWPDDERLSIHKWL